MARYAANLESEELCRGQKPLTEGTFCVARFFARAGTSKLGGGFEDVATETTTGAAPCWFPPLQNETGVGFVGQNPNLSAGRGSWVGLHVVLPLSRQSMP